MRMCVNEGRIMNWWGMERNRGEVSDVGKRFFHSFQIHISVRTAVLLWAPYRVNEEDDDVVGPDREWLLITCVGVKKRGTLFLSKLVSILFYLGSVTYYLLCLSNSFYCVCCIWFIIKFSDYFFTHGIIMAAENLHSGILKTSINNNQ